MKRALWRIGIMLSMSVWAAGTPATSRSVDYHQDFEHAAGATLPDDFQVLAGEFAIAGDGTNHYLELPGDPLDTFGLLFGPANQALSDVSARIWSAPTGKRFPEFGIGCCDVSGYKLWVLPGQGSLELRKADDTRARVAFTWKSEKWTSLRLRVIRRGDHGWRVEGKAWAEGTPEPSNWMIGFDETDQPSAGRASLWGEPFSGKPIRFDDFSIVNPE